MPNASRRAMSRCFDIEKSWEDRGESSGSRPTPVNSTGDELVLTMQDKSHTIQGNMLKINLIVNSLTVVLLNKSAGDPSSSASLAQVRQSFFVGLF